MSSKLWGSPPFWKFSSRQLLAALVAMALAPTAINAAATHPPTKSLDLCGALCATYRAHSCVIWPTGLKIWHPVALPLPRRRGLQQLTLPSPNSSPMSQMCWATLIWPIVLINSMGSQLHRGNNNQLSSFMFPKLGPSTAY